MEFALLQLIKVSKFANFIVYLLRFLLPWVWIGMAKVPPTFDVVGFVEH
jgi:hypothetical protein